MQLNTVRHYAIFARSSAFVNVSDGSSPGNGGGSGGYVAVYVAEPYAFSGTISADGGDGPHPGGAGLLYVSAADRRTQLHVSGSGYPSDGDRRCTVVDRLARQVAPLHDVYLTRNACIAITQVRAIAITQVRATFG